MAGFVDNGFVGPLVFELISQETTDIRLRHKIPIGELRVFRTKEPDVLYGEEIGSHYQKQIGPKPAKFFGSFNFELAARNHAKLDRQVLVQDTKVLLGHRRTPLGFEQMNADQAITLFEDIEKRGFFHSRYDCEDDPLTLQVISYVPIFGPDGKVFSYVRAENIQDYGDKRLFGKHSIGLGGHIQKKDGPDFIRQCLERKVMDEEVKITGKISTPKLVGTLFQPDNPIDRVHFGLIYVIHTDGTVSPKESSIISGRMIPISEIIENSHTSKKYETWSRVLASHLPEIYTKTRN